MTNNEENNKKSEAEETVEVEVTGDMDMNATPAMEAKRDEEVAAEKLAEKEGEDLSPEELDEEISKVEGELSKEQQATYLTEFAFDIDCIVEDINTERRGRVESLTVNKYHEKEYYVEGKGVSGWIAEKHLKLIKLPAEIKMKGNARLNK